MIVVSVQRNGQLHDRSGQSHAEIVLPTSIATGTVRAVARGERRLQTLWKESVVTNDDGEVIGHRRDEAGTVTLLRVDFSDVIALTYEVARGCGHKTVTDLQEVWFERHPRSPRVAVVWFALGDWRDRNIYLNWTGRGGGDYTKNASRAMDRDAPALTDEEMAQLSSVNRQKDEGRRARVAAALAAETPSQRVQRLNQATARLGAAARREIRQELRIIEQRVTRLEKRK